MGPTMVLGYLIHTVKPGDGLTLFSALFISLKTDRLDAKGSTGSILEKFYLQKFLKPNINLTFESNILVVNRFCI